VTRTHYFETLLALAVERRDELAESKRRLGNGYVGTVPSSSLVDMAARFSRAVDIADSD
jgi:hypothetical protein